MKTTKKAAAPKAGTQGKKTPAATKNNQGSGAGLQTSQLMKLFEDEVKDIYWAEKALTKALPKMIKNASSPELSEALTSHLEETKVHVQRIEQVFELMGKKAVAKKCDAMDGLIKESEGIIEDTEKGPMRDAGIISAGQKVEHYEIASYGTLRQFAETLGMSEAAALLEETLNEEKTADEKLTEVAVSTINIEASEEESDEENEETAKKPAKKAASKK